MHSRIVLPIPTISGIFTATREIQTKPHALQVLVVVHKCLDLRGNTTASSQSTPMKVMKMPLARMLLRNNIRSGGIEVDSQRQGQHQQQVGHRQVDHEDGAGGLEPVVAYQDPQGRSVERQTQHHNAPKDDGVACVIHWLLALLFQGEIQHALTPHTATVRTLVQK